MSELSRRQRAAIIWLLGALARLTPRYRTYLARSLAFLILNVAARTRTRALSNVQRAMPALCQGQAKQLCFRSYAAITLGLLDCLTLAELELDIFCDESVRLQLNSGQGLCVATLHTCCYELVPLAIQRLTGRSVTLTHLPAFIPPANNPYHQAGIGYIEKKSPGAFVRLLNEIQQGAVVTLHADLYAKDVKVRFFGRDTQAPVGPALLSAFAATPLLFAYGCKSKNGRYQVHIESFMAEPVSKSPLAYAQVMQQLYLRFERIILRYPEQWYWSSNRWRT